MGIAEVIAICLAVMIVGMASHRSSVQDRATVNNWRFWMLIAALAAAFDGFYHALRLMVQALDPGWRGPAVILVAVMVCAALIAWWVSKSERPPREMLKEALHGTWEFTSAVLIPLFAVPAAAYLVAEAFGASAPGWYAVLATVATVAGKSLVERQQTRRWHASVRRIAFEPLLQRWGVAFNENRYPYTFAVAITRAGVPLALEVSYFDPRHVPAGWVDVWVTVERPNLVPTATHFRASIPISWPCGATPGPVAIEYHGQEWGRRFADGECAERLTSLATQFAAGSSYSQLVVEGVPELRIRVSAAAEIGRVPELVDRMLDIYVLLQQRFDAVGDFQRQAS